MLNMRELIPWTRGREVTSGRRVEHPLVAFQREVDRLFDDLWRGFDLPLFGRPERMGVLSRRRSTSARRMTRSSSPPNCLAWTRRTSR
jgi:hypothetical protein